MFKKVFFLCSAVFFIGATASAAECAYGKLLGFDDAGLFVARVPQVSYRQYSGKQAHFIKNIRAAQIKKAFESESVAEAFRGADEGMIFKFEIKGNAHTSYDYLTVIFAYSGDTLVGAVFVDDSSNVAAYLDDGDIKVCEPALNN